jgi:hypothetical protein
VPIRTNRGRAAVYRKLWGWPLRSPRHLVTVCLFVLAIVLFLGYILPRMTGRAPAAQSTAASSSVSATPSSTSPTPTQGAPGALPPPPGSQSSPSLTETRQSPSENKTPARPDAQASDAAAKWAAAFVKHDGVAQDQWLNGLRPYTTDEYLATTLSKVDPASIPATKITGAPAATPDSYTSSVTFEVPTDAKKLSVTVVKTTAGWRVNEHDEVG